MVTQMLSQLFVLFFSEAIGSYAENRKIITIRKVYQVNYLELCNIVAQNLHKYLQDCHKFFK